MSQERDERTHAIIGAAMDVHRTLGCGFHEPVKVTKFNVGLLLNFGKASLEFKRLVLSNTQSL